jgi:hypothetical protein
MGPPIPMYACGGQRLTWQLRGSTFLTALDFHFFETEFLVDLEIQFFMILRSYSYNDEVRWCPHHGIPNVHFNHHLSTKPNSSTCSFFLQMLPYHPPGTCTDSEIGSRAGELMAFISERTCMYVCMYVCMYAVTRPKLNGSLEIGLGL